MSASASGAKTGMRTIGTEIDGRTQLWHHAVG
jgi:hypothetical protein